MQNNKSYRIRINENEEYVDVNLNLNQDIDMFEMLSLKIDSKNLYKLQTSGYGCVAGRVLANNAIGVPNVKLSIFIGADESTKADAVLNSLYPYSSTNDKNEDGVKYNLLTEEELEGCYQSSGTFPSKRLVLDDKNVFEIFDKYYKFTTTTNAAGDYMIFGVPTGQQTLHMDVDLSDIGSILSQTPRDFIYKGYDKNLFESPSQFKKSTDIGSLPQIISQDESVYVYPFWGDASEMPENDSTGVRISRKDINLSYKFEPTCIFLGSIISDEKSNGFSEQCVPTDRMGKMDRLTTGEGTIEMIRKTPDGAVESYNVGGAHLIDGDGVWCYQIPMNLDYIKTDENGNIVPSDDPNKGLPTRTSVRFRFSLNDFASDYENNHLCKVLVPNNPVSKEEYENLFAFGTLTNDRDFKDLLWNKVYSVKSYVPRLQKGMANREKRFSGIKAVNVNGSNNPVPYNNIRINLTLLFIVQCAILHTLIWLAGVFNKLIKTIVELPGMGTCTNNDNFYCITVGDGACPDLDGWYFAPECQEQDISGKIKFLQNTAKRIKEHAEDPTDIRDTKSIDYSNYNESTKFCVSASIGYFIQCIELALAQEYEVIQFDFYNDWLNGVLYIPRWFAKVKKKRSYLFGLIKAPERIYGCLEDRYNLARRYVQQCALTYNIQTYDDGKRVSDIKTTNNFGCAEKTKSCHKGYGRRAFYGALSTRSGITPGGGIVHSEKTTREQYAYYFRPCDFWRVRTSQSQFEYDGGKVTYFATDIILLGSVLDNDIDGIPKIKEYLSSTYKMPTPLAATNMDAVGYMFSPYYCAGSDTNETKTAGAREAELSTYSDTFGNYQTWAQETDFGGSTNTQSDNNEYPITEAAGIDWGYTGPELSELDEEYGIEEVFQPGGHFLGLSCFNSETTVKSCLNLSRVCEIGVGLSRRQQVHNVGDVTMRVFLIPSGFISKYELTDSDIRSIFATLNHNDLATERDETTGRHLYKFIPLLLTNFDGTAPSEYIELWDENYTKITDNVSSHARVVETKSGEEFDEWYYNFRMGVNNDRTKDIKISRRYAYGGPQGSTPLSLPQYRNSFYFYFGLHDGATALDKFYTDFYGECNTVD